MSAALLSQEALRRVKHIHQLSSQYNSRQGKPHTDRLLELMDKHVREIRELVVNHDPHGLVENGDLLILCLELLIEQGQDSNDIFERCCLRYEQKLEKLLKDDVE